MKRCEKWLKTQGEFQIKLQSLPSRERGLKQQKCQKEAILERVAPLAGAWIEIPSVLSDPPAIRVAPLAGVWIEMVDH